MKISFIGVGDMGSEMVPHLAAGGHEVTIWDTNPDRLTAFHDDHIKAATSLEDAVTASPVIITSVMSADVMDLHLGHDGNPGIVHYLKPDSILIVTSTLDPNKIFTINKAMPENTTLLDISMIGGVRYAREANLALLAGGESKSFDRVLPVLNLLGLVKYVGPVGSGAQAKLVTNVGIMAAESGIRETLDLADAYHMDYSLILELLQLGPLKPVILRALDVTNPRPLKDSVADVEELLNATKELIELPITAAGAKRLREAVDEADGETAFIDITDKKTALPQYKDQ
ncbi:NAD(P)-dependent oxidoreductase [Lacticaseibacillus brantae]|uniref:3-hydroxyisobutyrate dehydrogenase related beta-hydroxyacid dehydrogenase n=1 Tax=Lacticaseibacillus brantae DSM 23927 TaxID=1423727 RepID=A0A0R2AX29_9LACO|nr:NAD(P)-binding domain-containing protein [Lacticaseibacillus brantae]KRM72001.1 3-hydroxyisobutyrate dehydrogenase related beta-hydroxyacid dehydrogenase [Lacticaseibacillus brantae DSM 23927]